MAASPSLASKTLWLVLWLINAPLALACGWRRSHTGHKPQNENQLDRLDDHVLERIVDRLHLKDLAKARCISPRLNAMVLSKPRMSMWELGFFMHIDPESVLTLRSMLSPDVEAKLVLPRHIAAMQLCWGKVRVMLREGLVLISSGHASGMFWELGDFWVGNPLRKEWRRIPASRNMLYVEAMRPGRKHHLFNGFLDETSNTLHLVYFYLRYDTKMRLWDLRVLIFNSARGTWRKGDGTFSKDRPDVSCVATDNSGMCYLFRRMPLRLVCSNLIAYDIRRDQFSFLVHAGQVVNRCMPDVVRMIRSTMGQYPACSRVEDADALRENVVYWDAAAAGHDLTRTWLENNWWQDRPAYHCKLFRDAGIDQDGGPVWGPFVSRYRASKAASANAAGPRPLGLLPGMVHIDTVSQFLPRLDVNVANINQWPLPSPPAPRRSHQCLTGSPVVD